MEKTKYYKCANGSCPLQSECERRVDARVTTYSVKVFNFDIINGRAHCKDIIPLEKPKQ